MKQKVYVIISEYTGSPYVDEKRNAYIFPDAEKAGDFTKKVPGTTAKELEANGKELLTMCFAAGAGHVYYETKYIRLEEEAMDRRFYNGDPNANICRYAHTKNRIYLEHLRDCRFLIPIRITNRPEVSAVYATISLRGEPWYYMAFTDLEEFHKWHSGNEWQPLRVDFYTLHRLGKKHGFLLNLYGMKLVMPPEMLRNIEKGWKR